MNSDLTSSSPRRHGDILLVRHGETNGNRTKVLQQPTIPLNENGHRQARKAGERIASTFKVAKILCSDLQRTQDTAAPIKELTGAPLELTPLLQERNFGDLRGRPFSELHAEGVEVFHHAYQPPNGESVLTFADRVSQAWQQILQAVREVPPGQVLVVVTHGLVLNQIAKTQLELAKEDLSASIIAFRNTSISLVDANCDACRKKIIHIFNDDSHLSEEDRDPTFGQILGKAKI